MTNSAVRQLNQLQDQLKDPWQIMSVTLVSFNGLCRTGIQEHIWSSSFVNISKEPDFVCMCVKQPQYSFEGFLEVSESPHSAVFHFYFLKRGLTTCRCQKPSPQAKQRIHNHTENAAHL